MSSLALDQLASTLPLPEPSIRPELDPGFRPAVLANRRFLADVAAAGGGVPLVFGLERSDGTRSRIGTRVFAPTDPRFASSLHYAERLFNIWRTMGVYMGYAVAHYADYYPRRHVLILGRCTSGRGGPILLDHARAVLQAEFPDLAARINLQLPDEKSRRGGQSVAAASLPALFILH